MGIPRTSVPATNVVTAPAAVGPAPQLEPGARIGRYVVLFVIGSGGMGVVYAANDPELDRRVAIKVVRPAYGRVGLEAQARLLREAQVLAQLSHPNIITVHDVGTIEDDVFVAMDYIDGETLRDFADAPGRTRDEVLAAIFASGRGLAAAHALGVVHRDFKPDNVMVASDGRVLVLDFGLARPEIGGSLPSGPPSWSGRSSDEEVISLTETGAAMGTPAYMAPEQHTGLATPASDQYSFCVTLYELLCGHRPFAGVDMRSLQREKLRARRIVLPPEARVPRWQQQVIARGLDRDPARRFDSMDALVDALEHAPADRRRRRLRWAMAGTVVVAGAIAAAGGTRDPCAAAGEVVEAGVWDADARAAVERSILASNAPYAATSASTVLGLLDAHADALVEGERAACVATHVDKTQSEGALDLRNACLDQRETELAALVSVLTEAGAPAQPVAGWAVDAALSLPSPATCDDVTRLETQASLPTDPGERRRARELRGELGRVSALVAAGRYDESQAPVDRLLVDAQTLEHGPLLAEVYYLRAELLHDQAQHEAAIADYLAAIDVAADFHLDALQAAAWIDLAFTTGHSLARYDDAESMLRAAEAAVRRAGDDPEQRADLLRVRAQYTMDRGDHRRAHDLFALSLELRGEPRSPDKQDLAARTGLARTLAAMGEYDAARKIFVDVTEVLEAVRGVDHPKVAQVLTVLGQLEIEQGRFEEGLGHYERALRIQESSLADDHPELAYSLSNVAGIYGYLGRLDEAAGDYARARSILERRYGTSHPMVARVTFNIAELCKQQGDLPRARSELERALAIFVESLGDDHPDAGKAYNNLGAVFHDLGLFDEAVHNYAESLRVLEPVLGPEHPNLAYPLTGLGQAHLELGELDASARYLERAVALREGADGIDPVDLGDSQYALARTLWAQEEGGARGRALALAQSAVAEYERAEEGRQTGIDDVRRWLATRPRQSPQR